MTTSKADATNHVIRKEASNLHILKLSFLYFATGMLMFLTAMIIAIWFIPDLASTQSMRNPKGWSLAHILILGWASMVAMGASFQLTQVVMRTALFSRSMAYIQYVLYTLGYLLMVTGFFVEMRLIAIGGSCLTLGVILYVFNLIMTFILKKEWNVFVFGVSLSLAAFLITIILGIRMGLAFAFDGYSNYYEEILGSHLWFGIAGWLSGFIVIFTFKLLPMFYISSKKPALDAYLIIAGYHVGIWLHIISLWFGIAWTAVAGSVIMLSALGWFIAYVLDIRKKSRSKRPVGVISIAFYLLPAVSLLFLIWNVNSWLGSSETMSLELLIVWIVLGWFSPTILSYLSKILPFLWWAHRFQTREEKKNAVLLTDMLPERRMTYELLGYSAGIAAVIAGYGWKLPTVALIGQGIAVLFTIVYLRELMRVFRY